MMDDVHEPEEDVRFLNNNDSKSHHHSNGHVKPRPPGDDTAAGSKDDDVTSSGSMTFDELLIDHVGECGRYQAVMVTWLAMIGIPAAFGTMEMVFLTLVPDHWCNVGPMSDVMQQLNHSTIMRLTIPDTGKSDTYEADSCKMYDRSYVNATQEDIDEWMYNTSNTTSTVECDAWYYQPGKLDGTLTVKFNMVCYREMMIATSQSVHMAGVLLGTLLSGVLADRLGRKPVYVLGMVGQLIGRILCGFSVNFIMYCALRFFIASMGFMWYSACYVMSIEMVGPSWRVRLANFITFFWGVGCILLTPIAFYVPDWSPLLLVCSAASLPFLPTIWFLPESPRWLYTVKQTEKADGIVKTMAKWNKTTTPDGYTIALPPVTAKAREIDLLRTPQMRKISLVSFYTWFVCSFVYYGLSLATPSVGNNVYVSYGLSAIMEVLAVFICLATLDSPIGRMGSLRISLAVGGVALLATLFVPTGHFVWMLVLTSLGKLSICAVFNIIYLLATEMFPTVVRTLGLGMSSMFARFGSIIAPFIAILGQSNPMLPVIIFGCVCISSALLTLLLSETRGKKLPDTIAEVERTAKKGCRSTEESEQFNPDRETDI